MLDNIEKTATAFRRGAYVIMRYGVRMQRLGAIVTTEPSTTVLMYNHDRLEWKPYPVEFNRDLFVRFATQTDLNKYRYIGVSNAPGFRIHKERLKRRLPGPIAEEIADALHLVSRSLTPDQLHANITGIVKMWANGEGLTEVIDACRPKLVRMRKPKGV